MITPRRLRTTRGLLAAFIVAWQILTFASSPELWPHAHSSAVLPVLFAIVIAIWLATLVLLFQRSHSVGPIRGLQILNFLVLLAIAAYEIAAAANAEDVWSSGASVVTLSVAIAGLAFPLYIALAVIFAVAIGEVIYLHGLDAVTYASLAIGEEVSFGAYALAVGIAAAVSASALTRLTDRRRAAESTGSHLESGVEAAELSAAELRAQEVLIHESVLNTLTALSQGAAESVSQKVLRERIEEAHRVLTAVTSTPSPQSHVTTSIFDLRVVTQDIVGRLQSTGVHVRVKGSAREGLPPEVVRALGGAVREALLNIERHSQASEVLVELRVIRGAGLRITVSDDGVGFDSSQPATRFGLSQAIRQSVSDSGGRVDVQSTPGRGTTLEVSWAPRPTSQSLLRSLSASIALPTLAAFAAYAIFAALQSMPEVNYPTLNLLSLLAIVAGMGCVGLAAARGSHMSRWLILGVGLAAVGYLMQEASTGNQSGGLEWAAEPVAVTLFVANVIGPGITWLLTIPVWFVIQGNPLAEILAPGFIIIALGVVLGAGLRANSRALIAAEVHVGDSRTRIAGANFALKSMQARGEVVGHSATADYLQEILGRERIEFDASDRALLAQHEAYIRSVMTLDPASNDLDLNIAHLAEMAWDRRVRIDIRLGSPTFRRQDFGCLPSDSFEVLASALTRACPDSVARLTVLQDEVSQGAAIRLVYTPRDGEPLCSEQELVTPQSLVEVALGSVSAHQGDGE